MKLETPIPTVALLWACLVLPLASCLQLESQACSEELTCPSGMKCSADKSACIATPCGNGVRELEEQCDDGNLNDGDGCSRDCRSTEVCGNKTVDKGEVCDDGNRVGGDDCSADCLSDETCGNGVVDAAVGEVCDDSNTTAGDGCSAHCDSDERCGNRVTDSAVGEVCDEGDTVDGDGCSANCLSGESCGNGIRDVAEECDDKNSDNNDNCLNVGGKCLLSRCGDGVTDQELPGVEECDAGGESASCNLNCTIRECGDGIVNGKAGEECDTQGESSTCNVNCTVVRCGDGIVNPKAGEECDDGNSSNADGCLNTCRQSTCGDGVWQLPEVCDDGINDNCGACAASCQEYRLKNAEGSIIAVKGTHIEDGETFSIDDGLHSPKRFEFDKDDDIEDGNIPVPIGDNLSAAGVAKAIKEAINDVYNPSEFSIVAGRASGFSFVKLTNVGDPPGAGALGNEPMTETVGDPDFLVIGMSGGGGRDCAANARCKFNEDCVSGKCEDGFCAH
jgi:cysteine-rich repeat protein